MLTDLYTGGLPVPTAEAIFGVMAHLPAISSHEQGERPPPTTVSGPSETTVHHIPFPFHYLVTLIP